MTIFEPSHTTVDISAEYSVRDLVVVEVLQLAEAEDLGVEAHPVVEPALLDVADDVVDAGEADGRTDRRVAAGRRSW